MSAPSESCFFPPPAGNISRGQCARLSIDVLRSLVFVKTDGIVSHKAPLDLNKFWATEAVCRPPLGACAARDQHLEVAARPMGWLHTLANQAGLVVMLHRQLASPLDTAWVEPSPALALTFSEFGWKVVCNVALVTGLSEYDIPRLSVKPRLS